MEVESYAGHTARRYRSSSVLLKPVLLSLLP